MKVELVIHPKFKQLELSTQIIIAEALKRKVHVELLDESANFIRLSRGNHVEYIEAATKTSHDSYIIHRILENKQATKILLREQKIAVPEGRQYSSLEEALADFDYLSSLKKIVVKPKTTNCGIGIEILPEQFSRNDLEKAMNRAFQFDPYVLVEQFFAGLECRFLVIKGKCVAVLNRVPAYVIGDGNHTITELVAIANRDPRRGHGYKTPLEFIRLDQTEKEELLAQNLSVESIPDNGKQIFLRKNSNISTGGVSIDYTDIVDASYKKMAEKAVRTIGAQICGVDMIAQAFKQPLNPLNYTILELNSNPVLYFHNFPYQGQNRHVEREILDLLDFP